MSYMFACEEGKTMKFNGDIGNWDVSNTVYMNGMFNSANSFNQNIGNWDVSNTINMNFMFLSANSFNQDLSNWCVINIENEPTSFDVGASSWVLPRPIWGTCP